MNLRLFFSKELVFFPLLSLPLSVLNYIFLISVGRSLSIIEYGKANALLSLLSLMIILGIAIQLLTARLFASQMITSSKSLLLTVIKALSFCVIGFLVASQWLTSFLDVEIWALLWLLLAFGMHTITSLQRGELQGRKLFWSLNTNLYIEVVVKLAAFLILMVFNKSSIETFMLAVAIGNMAALLHGLIHVQLEKVHIVSPINNFALGNEIFQFISIQLLLQCFLTLDNILVAHFLPEQAGFYAVSQKYGLLILFFFNSILTVLFPTLNQQVVNQGKFIDTVHWASLGLFGIGGISSVLYFTLIPRTIPWLFGNKYHPAGEWLWAFAVISTLLAWVHLNTQASLAQSSNRSLIWLITGNLILFIAYLIWHSSVEQILIIQVVVYSTTAIGVYGVLRSHKGE